MLKTILNKQCSPGDYFILSIKKGSKWKDIPYKYEDEATLDEQLDAFYQSFPPEEYDLYFCPLPYSKPSRKKVNVKETKYLWQDIDERDDIDALEPKPSYVWESSPNKYQGLWEVDRYLEPEIAEKLNKELAYSIGLTECFELGHVLRIPNTVNHKYKDTPEVGDAIHTKVIYKYKNLVKLLSKKDKPSKEKVSNDTPVVGSVDTILKKYNIPEKVMDLLTQAEAEQGRRSDVIWYIENKLFEIGLEIPEIIILIKNSCWNKYKGRPDEIARLTKEAEKILDKSFQEGGSLARIKKEKKEFKIDSYGEVMSNMNTFPGWLIEGFWGRRAHGIVAGQPKVFKSTYAHDLAVSVASGRPFLGQYKVNEPGPVLIVQNENADWLMKDRTEKIIANRGLGGKVKIKSPTIINISWPEDIPLYSINQQGFQLDNLEHQTQIEKIIAELKPVLVIFDPLYLMFSGNLNAADELTPVLNWLLEIKNKYKTGVMVIHHYNKGTEANRGGQKMLGSVVLHGWVESAWYLRRKPTPTKDTMIDPNEQVKDPSSVIMEREFRTAGTYPELELKLVMGGFENPLYEVEVEVYAGDEEGVTVTSAEKTEMIKDQIVQILKSSPFPLNKKEIIKQYMDTSPVKMGQRKLKDTIDDMCTAGDIYFTPSKGYYVK